MQEQLMKYSPDTGEERPYPSNAKQWREYHGRVAWLYNPWTGEKRDLRDIGSDVLGELIVPDTEVSPGYCCDVEIPESNMLYDLGEEKVYSHHSKAENSPRGLADKLLRDFPTTDKVLTEKEMVILKSVEQAEKLVGCKLLYGHLPTHSDDVTTVNPVSQTLDDTEAMILEVVQSAERLLLGTTVVSYWVKFPLAAKVSSKLTREKETLVYVSGNTKTKYYCATENVAILAQSSVVLLGDDNSGNPVNKALLPCSSVMVDASNVERGMGGDKVDDFPNTLKRRFYELTPFQREILANNYTKVEHYRDNEWRTKKGTYFHRDGIYRVVNKHEVTKEPTTCPYSGLPVWLS